MKKVVASVKAINPDIWCVVDATQQLEHFPANCHQTNCDFLVGSAHKLVGPTGLGFTYISKNAQQRLNFDLKYLVRLGQSLYKYSVCPKNRA